MSQQAVERTLGKLFTEVVVATCDEEIAQVVRQAGGQVILTSASHPAATDRVAEAAQQLDCTHVMNIQGRRFVRTKREGDS